MTGRLEQPQSPFSSCQSDAQSEACRAAQMKLRNPFALQDDPGATQSVGWHEAWTSQPSAYAVVAANTQDVARAVAFARRHDLRVVIKGTGHDYLGRSSAPDSLLIWTHEMRRVETHEAFVAQGCSAVAVPAVSVEAGARWLEVYQEVAGKHRRYVQGGGCTSVGASGGFMQGGGFGSWSKKYGIAAASMLEAEVVTAEGQVVVANACLYPDLFWALRGGGGGTFGVVTRVTLETHPLPATFGALFGTVTATSDDAFRELLERFVRFAGEALSNEHWGEQVSIRRNNTLNLALVYQGLTEEEVTQIWQPLRAFVDQRAGTLTMQNHVVTIPPEKFWDMRYLEERVPGAVTRDTLGVAPGERWWWSSNQEEVSTFWLAYHSRWIPKRFFEGDGTVELARALYGASRHWTVTLHFNKGQANAAPAAVSRGHGTAMNPAVFDAAALAVVAANAEGASGESNVAKAEATKAHVDSAAHVIDALTPESGSYLNETDYFELDWQRSFWGGNYARLLEIKRAYDPSSLFYCHHCVGSEAWMDEGMCRR